jgi:hypothetical protein
LETRSVFLYQRNASPRTNTTSVVTWRLVAAVAATVLFICGSVRAGVRQDAASSVRSPDDSTTADSLHAPSPKRHFPLSQSAISVWGAGSVHPGGLIGSIPKGWVGLVGLRYHRLLLPPSTEEVARRDAPSLTYTADVIPIATVFIPKGTPPGTASPLVQPVSETGLSTFGMGVYPVGLQISFRPSAALRPFIAGHTGFFYFFDPIPDERGRHVNFAAGVGGGVEISLAAQTTLTLGYRYHHLSNGFRGIINPGLDANLLYIGVGLIP